MKTKTKKISVIIPVYNVKPYLAPCMESVLSQTYTHLQIILSDDGSTDGSGKLCDDYAAKDARVTVIHEKNAGLSVARNRGIDMADGEYIIFLDSDDYWESADMLKGIMACLAESDADMLVFGYKKLFDSTGQIVPVSMIGDRMQVKNIAKPKAFEYLIRNNILTSGAHRKISKTSLVKGKLYFEPGVTSEDIEWTARLIIAAKSVDYYAQNCYIYRQREGSITKTKTVKNVLQLQHAIGLCIDYGKKIEDTPFYQSYMGYAAYQYITSLANAAQLNQADYKKVYDTLRSQAWLLEYGLTKKVRLVRVAKKLLGFNLMMKVLGKYYLRKKSV